MLTTEQLIELTGYRRPGKQRQALERMGVRHFVRLDGRPVVDDSALSQKADVDAQPNWSALDE